MHAPERPGALGYWVAGCLPAAVIACSLTALVVFIVTGTADLGSIQGADGSVTFQVEQAGQYHCFAEGDGFQPNPTNFTGLTLVADASPGAPPTFGLAGTGASLTYDLQGQQGVAIRTVHFPAPGRYTIATQWDGDPPGPQAVSRLKFGRFNFLQIGLTFMGGCCGSGLAVVVSIILIFVTYKRRADWDKLYGRAAPSFQGPGFGDYADTPLPPPTGWDDPPGPPPGPGGEPPDAYRSPPEQPLPPDEDRLY